MWAYFCSVKAVINDLLTLLSYKHSAVTNNISLVSECCILSWDMEYFLFYFILSKEYYKRVVMMDQVCYLICEDRGWLLRKSRRSFVLVWVHRWQSWLCVPCVDIAGLLLMEWILVECVNSWFSLQQDCLSDSSIDLPVANMGRKIGAHFQLPGVLNGNCSLQSDLWMGQQWNSSALKLVKIGDLEPWSIALRSPKKGALTSLLFREFIVVVLQSCKSHYYCKGSDFWKLLDCRDDWIFHLLE